jgi:hypothetical protein
MAIITCCLSEDSHVARRWARETFLGRLKGNPEKRLATLDRRHWDEVRRLAVLVRRGELERAIDEADDAIVDQFIAVGSASKIHAVIERYLAAGCTRVALASYPRDAASVKRLLRAMAPSLAAR